MKRTVPLLLILALILVTGCSKPLPVFEQYVAAVQKGDFDAATALRDEATVTVKITAPDLGVLTVMGEMMGAVFASAMVYSTTMKTVAEYRRSCWCPATFWRVSDRET